jgi:ParB family chromosome partitioning protein
MNSYSNELIGSVDDINMSDIDPPANPLRSNTNGVEELVESIKKIGLIQPIVVRIARSDRFEIVAGNRRFNACKKLGWRKITGHIVELDDKTAFEVTIIENVQRHTLSPLEEALAFKKYVKVHGWGSISELAHKISKSPSYVCKRIKLVELPQDIIDLISSSEINVSSAQELLFLKDKSKQFTIASAVRDKKLTARNTRGIIKADVKNSDAEFSFSSYKDYHWGKERILRSFDRSIIALRLAIKKLSYIVEAVDDDWIFCNIILHHKNTLNSQIDLLIKEKKKYKKKFIL